MRQATFRFFLLPLFFVLVCAGAFAQTNSSVTGIVTDQMGAAISGAVITLTDEATGTSHTTTSGSTGLYSFAELNPSSYDLKVTAKGFEGFVQKGITVNISGTFRVDAKLTVGASSETVTVQADALAVQTDSNVVSSLISSTEITALATENRVFAALAALTLGASSAVPDNNTLGAFGSNFTLSINGLRQTHNIWLIDGGESSDRGGGGGMQILPSQDAIAEFNTLTSNYPPDYGISSGATISLSLKSGGKAFHGTAWEENRATAYNANNYFYKRPDTHYNIYGFNVGGPLYIPHTYNSDKKKTFFFWNEEWRKTSAVASSNTATIDSADVPNAANTAGGHLTYVAPTYAPTRQLIVPNVSLTSDFYLKGSKGDGSNSLKTLGLTPGQAFPNNQIPAALFDASAVTYLTAGILPKANVGTTDFAIAAVPLPTKVRDDVIRVDHNFNDKWAILGHYIGDTQVQGYGQPELGWTTANYNTLGSNLTSPAHSAAIKLSGTINPNLLVEASFNYDGNASAITPSANSFLPTSWATTWTPVVPQYAVTRNVWPGMYWDSTLPANGGGGNGEDTATEPYHNGAQDYTPKVDVSYTMGKHAFKFGFSYNRYTKNQMIYGDEQGSYNFGSLSNDTLMDTLMGLSSKYTQDQLAPVRHYVNQTPSVYAMDNWHVTPRLSLQLGIRYDALPQTQERQNLLGNFDQANYLSGAANAPVWTSTGTIDPSSAHLYTYIPQGSTSGIQSYINGTDLAGQYNTPRAVVKNDYKTLQPRIGFSDDLFGNGKTVIRGGFGTFYERMQGNSVFGVATSAPFNPSLNVQQTYFSHPGTYWNALLPNGNVQSITANQLIFAGNASSMAQNFRAPAVAMYSLGVQREVIPSIVWVVQYVGNVAWHQNVINAGINTMAPNIGSTTEPWTDPATLITSTVTEDPRCLYGDSSGKGYNPNNLPTATPAELDALPDHVCNAGFNQPGAFNSFRQYQGYAQISQDQNNTNGNYNGFQTGLRIQNRWGLSGELNYTWSHEIDLTYQDRVNLDNPWNPKYDKGSGFLDRRHIINADYIYNLPIFNKSQGLIKSIAGGWQIAGTLVKETGVPVSVGLSANYDPIGLGEGYTNRPNITPGGKLAYPKKLNQWFDTTRIDNNVKPSWLGGNNLGFGTWGKDTLVGPGRFNLTTALYKNFQIYKTATFQIRGESFNTLNHTEWNGINVGNGKVTSAYDPRNLEVGGRFVF
jgi:hypothetical protein